MCCSSGCDAHSLLPGVAGYDRDESPDGVRVGKYVEGRVRRVAGERFHKKRTASKAIPQQPEPEIGTLAGSPECPPDASRGPEIQEDNRVRGAKPDFRKVIRAQVAIQYPLVVLDKPLLEIRPPVVGHRGKTRQPKDLIQFDYRQTGDSAKLHRQRRLA
jgi:hypothetical protein